MTAFLALGLCLLVEPIPKGEREGTIVIVKNHPEPVEVIVMRSSGKIVKRFEPKGIEGIIVQIRLSPDISRAIVHSADRDHPGMKPPEKVNGFYIIQTSAYLVNLEKPDEPAKLLLDHVNNLSYASWAPDSRSFYFCETDIERAKKRTNKDPLPYQTWKCSIPDGKKESFKIASQDYICDLSANGSTFLSMSVTSNVFSGSGKVQSRIIPLKSLESKTILDGPLYPRRISPDGKRILAMSYDENRLFSCHVVDINSKAELAITKPNQNIHSCNSSAWLMKGEKIATLWDERLESPTEDGINYRPLLAISGPDGKNAKVIYRGEPQRRVTLFDCR